MKLKNFFQKINIKGFTFIELILYIGIVTIMMSALIPFAWNIIMLATKNTTEREVYSQARYISEKMKNEIRNASDINLVSVNSISLATSNSSTNPTIIDLSGGKIRIKQGTGSITNLNSDDTFISSLTFTNNSSVDGLTKNISFDFTITDNATSSKKEFVESSSIKSSAEVRTN